MSTSGTFVELRAGRERGWVREDLAGLGLDGFWASLKPIPGAKGRGGVGTLEVRGRPLVVRPFRRGGWFAGLLGDRYLSPRRARDELYALYELQQRGIPVVTPVAAVGRRSWLCWRLRLCTEQLADARTVPQFLAARPGLRRRAAAAVAATVRAAFEAGLRHPDLHLDNVLCTGQGGEVSAFLVDLDRARLEPGLDERAREAMLARMLRYCVKHRERLPAVPSRAESMRFLVGLGVDRAGRRRLWRALVERVGLRR